MIMSVAKIDYLTIYFKLYCKSWVNILFCICTIILIDSLTKVPRKCGETYQAGYTRTLLCRDVILLPPQPKSFCKKLKLISIIGTNILDETVKL